jgi:hypothetical protein
MATNSATVVAASLDSLQLEASINSLVKMVAQKTKAMADNFTSEVGRMEQAVKNLGNIKINSGGAADGGSSRRAKLFSQEGEVIQRNNQIAKEYNATLDQQAAAIRKASQVSVRTGDAGSIRNADTLQTMNIQLDLLRERLREARQQYSSFVAMASSATKTGDKGLYQFATEGVHKYGDEVRTLIPQIRGLQNAIQQMGDVIAPQGHTIQNYVNSLQKANPELALLNEQFKKGQSELQNQSMSYSKATQSAHQYTEEIRKQAQAIRESQQWKEKGYATVNGVTLYNLEKDTTPLKSRISLEEQLLQLHKSEESSMMQQATEEEKVAQATRLTGEELKKIYANQKAVNDEINRRANGVRNGGATPFQSYDNLRQSIASVLGIQEQQVKMADTEKDSYNKLASTLKQLKQAYDTLGKPDRNSDQGKTLVASMHEVERAMQKIHAQASRPVSLESIIGINGKGGLSEKTLDDIAYKMQRLSSLRSGLNVETQKKEISTVNAEYDRLKKKMDEVMQKNQSMIASNNALGRSWNYMKNRLAFYFTVGASTQFIKNLIEVRSQYEMNEKALGILLDSASRGTRIFNELSQMSLVSPYTLIELSSAAKQLTAYDIAAKDVVDTTRRLADMASAVGVPVERLTYALGQIKAYGYLNSRDARMFANAGIPLVKQLADYYSELEGKMVSTADVYDRMKKKAIDYNDVMKVVTKMTDEGGKFFDFQAKMADTLKVRLANLTLAWNNMLNELGKSNQGSLNTGIKSLTIVFRHWREIYRVLSTVIVALGAYKAATMLAGITTKSSIGSSAVASWFSLAKGVKSAKDAVALFSLTLKSIPFTAWVTMIATLASYFYLFNNSTDGLKQKLEDIATAFDGVRKEITDLYADALKSDRIGSQLTKLRDMLELAQTELGVTIPIKLEEVNEGNVKQKLKEVKNIIDNYLNFSQEFSEAAAGTKFNELMNEFGANARSTYTGISESINTVVVALQNLVDKGNASKRDLEILNELTSGQKEDESRIEYLQRLVRLYEELGLVGKKVTTPSLSFYSSSTDNMNELAEKQNQQLDRLGIKNKQVFENMLKDVQGYYSSSSIAQYQFEQQVERVAKRIDINNIPEEQRTLKLSAAINEEASLNNWNQFEKEFARQVANERFGTTIEISDESKGVAEQDLKDWQKKQQEWAAKNGITIPINFQTNDTEISYAKRMLQAAKDAKEEVEVQQRKLAVGTGSQDAVDAAKKAYENARILAKNAGADLEQLDKKANAAAKKAAKAAESELAKALKDELSTIDKVRSIYKELTKEGMSHADAVKSATEGWNETVNAINKVLTKNGLKALNLADFVGIDNPREILNTLQSQLKELVKRGAGTTEIKVLQEKIKTVKVDADKYDLTMITKGLNNELDRLKDEYELAVSLDADPELGNAFADWMGIDINDLPRTAQEYANKASKVLNRELKELGANIKLPNLLSITDDDMRAFEQNKTLTQAQLELVKKRVEESRGFYKKEVDDRINGWNTLLEKYSEYEAKINKIQNDAAKERVAFAQQFGSDEERSTALKLQTQILAATDPNERQQLIQQLQELVKSIAGDNKTKINLVTSINNSEQQSLAKASFEEFQKTPEWLIATGDLSTLTDRAIGGLIRRIEEYKKKAKNLDPKQIKNLNNALKNLRKQQREGNPFLQIANAIDEAKERAAELKPEMDSIMSDIIALEKEIGDSDATEEQEKHIKILKERWKELAAQGGVSATEIVSGINSSIAAASQAISMFTDMADALGGQHMTEATQTIKDVAGVLEKAGQGAAIGAQIGGGWGALIGGVAGGLAGLITNFADRWSGNKAITDSVKDSEMAVRRLELAYVDLQQAVDKAYGTAVVGAKQATLANKELQLAEIQRQIELEKSRKSKNRDEDKILDLQKQYKELFYEIKNGYNEIVDDLMGTDVASFAENLVSSMVDAFKQGEDYMKVFSDKFDEMIDNMIMKSIVSRVVSQYLDGLWESVNKNINERTKGESDEVARLQNEMTRRMNMSDAEIAKELSRMLDGSEWWADQFSKQQISDYRKAAEREYEAAQAHLEAASMITDSDIDYVMGKVAEITPELGEKLKNIIGEYYKFGESSETQLSALQQGIQGITEDTAGALEAITSGMSQQVYYQSTLLEQIRDVIIGSDSDIQLGVQGQILLQLQTSYQTQQAIQSILEGWSSPNGMSVRVEMI